MKPKSPSGKSQFQLFQAHFDQILNHDHPLILLANKIDWLRFETELEDCYCPDNGDPALPTRLLVGLHYLKHAFNES
ncbi:MAG: IS5/IS1182 family transposase, partial [Planctomycetaceae bacterium]|nr:IS5/IS1182 family transposase [Planctomycetaceae bacterium]